MGQKHLAVGCLDICRVWRDLSLFKIWEVTNQERRELEGVCVGKEYARPYAGYPNPYPTFLLQQQKHTLKFET